MIRHSLDIRGCTLGLSDERIGSVSRMLFDKSTWRIRWLVNDTGGWLSGRSARLLPLAPGRLDCIDLAASPARSSWTASPDTGRAGRQRRGGGRCGFTSFALGLMMTAISLAGSASAQIVGKTLTQSVNRYDVAAIDPILQGLLTHGKAGEVRDWSGSGKAGRVYLVSGGGSARCGRVRTTLTRGIHESRGYIFRYCRDAAGVWRTAG